MPPSDEQVERIQRNAAEALEKALTVEVRDRLRVGETVGLYTIAESDDRRLRLVFGSGVAALLVVLGAVFLVLDVWLFKTGTIRWARALPAVWKGAVFGVPVCGLVAVVMLGRSFEFVGAAGGGGAVARRRWLWVFGPEIDAARVAAVVLRLRPGYGSAAADRIQVSLVDCGGAEVLPVADEASDGGDVGAVLTLAVQAARVLGRPVRVEGEPKDMPDRAKDAVLRLREQAAA